MSNRSLGSKKSTTVYGVQLGSSFSGSKEFSFNMDDEEQDVSSSESSKSSWEAEEEQRRASRQREKELAKQKVLEKRRREKEAALERHRNRTTKLHDSGTFEFDDDSSLSDEEEYVRRELAKRGQRYDEISEEERLKKLLEWREKQKKFKKEANKKKDKEAAAEKAKIKAQKAEKRRRKQLQAEEDERIRKAEEAQKEEALRLEREREEREAEEARREQEEEERRQREAEEALRKAEEERKRKEAEEEARRKAAEEEEARRKAAEEEEARRRAAEEEARRKAEAERRHREEEEARLKKEEEARRLAVEEARRRREKEAAAEQKRKQKEKQRSFNEKDESLKKKEQAKFKEQRFKKLAKEAKSRSQKAFNMMTKASNHNVTNQNNKNKKTRAELAKEAEQKPTARPDHADVFQKKIKQVDPTTYQAPVFKKSQAEEDTIERALSQILPLSQIPKTNVDKLIGAFQKKDYTAGSEVEMYTQEEASVGPDEEDEYFFVVEKGTLSVEVDGKEVAEAKAGDTIGDTNLYHSSQMRQKSVIRVKPDASGRGASVMRIDQKTYRHILQTQSNKSDQDRLQLIQTMPYFEHLNPQLQKKLATALKPMAFGKGDRIPVVHDSSGKDILCIVSRGRLVCRGGDRAALAADANPKATRPVTRGQYFGDHVLEAAGDLMWLDTPLKVKAESEGVAYFIDRQTFEAVVGKPKDVLLTPQAAFDIQHIEGLKMNKFMDLSISEMQDTQSIMTNKFYKANETILDAHDTSVALYLVRQGTVKIKKGRFHRLKIAGGCFGEEVFHSALATGVPTVKPDHDGVVAKSDCICSKLALEDFFKLPWSQLDRQGKSPRQSVKKTALPEKAKQAELKKKLSTKKVTDDEESASDSDSSSSSSSDSSSNDEAPVQKRKPVATKKPAAPSPESPTSKKKPVVSSKPASPAPKSPVAKKKSAVRPPPKAKSPATKKKTSVSIEAEDSEDEEFYAPVKPDVKFENIEKKVMLGEGQFGQVWLVTDKTRKEKHGYALKIQSKFDLVSQAQAEICIREKTIMSEMNHPHIIKLLGSYQDTNFVYLLLEMINGGELFNRVYPLDEEEYNNSPGLPEDHVKFYTFVVADILKYLHEKKYVFRDLKPENILIGSNGYPILIDFGFAKKLTEKTFTLCGTPGYLSPEMVLSLGHSFAVDHWALGVMTYEMTCKANFFFPEGMDPISLYKCIAEDEFEPPVNRCSKEGCDFMTQMLVKDPVLRLGSLVGGENDVLTHPWFKGMDRKLIRRQKLTAPWLPTVKDPLDTSNFDDWSDITDKTTERYPPLSEKQEFIFEDF